MWTATAMATPPLPLTAAEATILRQITLTDVLTFKALDVARSLPPSLPPSLSLPIYCIAGTLIRIVAKEISDRQQEKGDAARTPCTR